MRINRVQSYNETFGAKLKVINKDFDKKFFHNLSAKAKNIGQEYDVIELRYKDFQDIVENKAFERKNVLEPLTQRLSEVFTGRFIPCGDDYGTDYYETKLNAHNYRDIWEKEETVAEKYLYILGKIYSP